MYCRSIYTLKTTNKSTRLLWDLASANYVPQASPLKLTRELCIAEGRMYNIINKKHETPLVLGFRKPRTGA